MSDSILAWLRLTRLPSIGPILTKRLLENLGSAEAILTAHPATLASIEGIGTYRANQIVGGAARSEAWAAEELARTQAAGVELITQRDPRYPPALLTITDPPLLLYVRGRIVPEDALAIGIVGARECTLYGREQAARFGNDLAQARMTVISGGARGIDTAAHEGALRAGGRTVVVQGCGLSNTYPPENAALYRRIVEAGGAIVSELPIEAPPSKENFPPRNRIIAGMSLGVLVVEANLRSGSLITARLAAADYGREVFALPGRVDSPASAGTHHLLKTGSAHLVESVDDILEHLGDIGTALRKQPRDEPATKKQKSAVHDGDTAIATELFPPTAAAPTAAPARLDLTSVQQKILAGVAPEGSTIDDLLEATALAPGVLMAELTMLQIRGLLVRLPANRFGRA